MLCVNDDTATDPSQRQLKDYPLNKLYIALKIILLSSSMGMPAAFAVDLPSLDAGCDGGTTTCSVTSTLGTDFDVTSSINAPGHAINADATVTGSTFTIGSGVTVAGGITSAGFNFASGSSANTITNDGTIQGGHGINFNSGNDFTVINNGLIDSNGGAAFYGLGNFGSGFTLTNNEGATISGSHTVIDGVLSSGGVTINNAGAITPDDGSGGVAIKLFGSNNTINLNTSSAITGDIQLATGQTNNTINLLGGSAATGTFSNYVNSNTINLLNINAPGKEWDISGTLPVAGAIHLQSGNVLLTGTLTNSGTGGTTINSGSSFQVGNGGTTGVLNDTVINDGTLTFNRSDDVTFTDDISGTGNVVQAGTGLTNLAGSGTWSGGTQVTSGTLNGMSATNALGTGAVNVTNGAILQLGDASTFTDYYFSANALSLEASTLRRNGTQASALSSDVTYHFDNLIAPISLSNSTLDFEQTAGANSIFDGDVDAINTSSLNYVGDSGVHTLAMNGNLTGSGTLSLYMSENNTGSLNLSFNGATNNYTGTVSLNGDAYSVDVNTPLGQAAWSITGAQTLNFNGSNTHVVTALSSDANGIVNITDVDTILQLGVGTVNGVIGGLGDLTKTSTGILSLDGVNTYTGSTKITGGTVNLGIANAIASSTSVDVDSNTTLALKNFDQVLQDLSGAGTLTLGSGDLTAQSNTDTTFDGTITGSGGLTKTGASMLTLSNAGNSVGAAEIAAGILHLTQTGTFNAASLLVDSGATAQLDSTAQIATTGTSTVNGTLDVTLGGTTPMLTAADATLNTSSSVLNISGYSGSTVAKASDLDAARTVVIHTTGGITGDFSAVEGIGAGNADYIVVDAKKSTDGNDYSIGSSLAWNAVAPLSSGIFTLTNASDAFDVDVVLADQAANGLTWDGQSLTKLGDGTLTLSAANTYTGVTRLLAGTLKTGIANAFADSASMVVGLGSTFDLNNFNQQVQNISGGGDIALGTATLTMDNSGNSGLNGVISGTGGIVKEGAGTLTLTGDSTYTGGTQINGGKLSALTENSLGAATSGVTIDNNAILDVGAPGEFMHGITLGSGGGTLIGTAGINASGLIDGTGRLTTQGVIDLTADNTYTGGTTINNSATLSLGRGTTTGSVQGDIIDNGVLALSRSNDMTLAGAISGSGRVDVLGAGTATLTGANSYSGGTNVYGNLRLTDGGTLGSGAVEIATPGVLHIDTPTGGSYTFDHVLTGSGTLQANLAATTDTFAFGSTTGNAFSGSVQLGQGQFSLSGDNTAALTNATLQLNTGNTTTVAAADQNIGNLTLNGGTIAWSGQTPPQTPVGKVNVTDLTLTSGTVQVDVPETGGIANPVLSPGLNLLAQDDGDIQTQLVAASGSVTGDASGLALVDSTGQAVNNPQTLAITEGGATVANGSYDFLLSTGSNNDGLYLGYGLKGLDLVSGQTLHLSTDSGATSNSAVLNAQLTGSGNLDVNGSASAAQTLTFNNAANSYTGTTTVSGGTLVAGSNNALGATSELILQDTTGFDLNGKTQTVGSLSGAAGSTLNINGGNLTLSQGGQSDGTLTGAGSLTLNDGTMTVNGANGGLSAAVILNNSAQALLSDVAGLGTGTVNLNGAGTELQLNGATGALANALSGTGDTHLLSNAAVGLSGNNSGFGGSFTLDNGTRLTAGVAQNLGTAVINNSGALVLDSSTDWAFINTVSGSGTLEKSGSGNLSVNSANTYTGGTTVSAGTLTLTNAQGAGSGTATIAAPATLAVNVTNGNFSNAVDNAGLLTLSGDGNQLSGDISGSGTNRVLATHLTISGDNSGFDGVWDLASGSSSTVTAAQNLGTGSVGLNGTLNVAPASGNYVFTQLLNGQGVLNVAMAAAADRFSFGTGSGSAFAGLVNLGQGAFTLSGTDTQALTNATLQIQSAHQTVGVGTQNVGNLVLNGGSSTFDVLTHSLIQTNQLALNGGEIRVNGLNTLPDPSNAASEPLLQQDDIIGDALILSQGNTGSSANLTLTDGLGNPLGLTTADVTQLGNVVGVGTYSYGLTDNNLQGQTGVFLYSGLIKLDLLAGQQVSLIQNGSAPLGGNEMHALITGAGGLNINVMDTATLNNPLNDYTGQTTVTNGTLRLGFNHTLGNTSSLDLLGTSQVDLNGKTQSVGALNSAAGTLLNLNGGTLTLTDSQRTAGNTYGGTVFGGLTGSGTLIVDPSVLTIDGANPTLSANTVITGGSAVRLNNVQGLGTGSITLDAAGDLLTFETSNGQTASGALNNTLLGLGSVQLDSSEVISLAADNATFNGNFTLGNDATLIASASQNLGTASITDNGTLQIDNSSNMTLANSLTGTGDLVKSGSGTLTVYQPAYSGTTAIHRGTLVVGDGTQSGAKLGANGAGAVTVASGATLAGDGTVSGGVNNSGTLASLNSLSAYGSAAASILNLSSDLTNSGLLQLAGASVGNTLSVGGNYIGGGVLALQTVLGGDNSVTDKLVVAGNTSGTTQVTVKNAGGAGAQTNTGIQVVDVGGQSDGVFNLNGRAVAGAYEYHLVKNSSNGDWYLQSQDSTPTPPTPTPASNYRPEPGAYLANQRAAQNMFLHTLYDRSGAARSQSETDMAKGWVRLGGDYTKQKSDGGLFDEKTHTTLVQLGSDVYQLDGVNGDQINAGVMGGYGHSTSNVSVQNSGYEAKGQVNGYSVGGLWHLVCSGGSCQRCVCGQLDPARLVQKRCER